MTTPWKQHAESLAQRVTHPVSGWRAPVTDVPRHVFVPRWWTRTGETWTLRDGPADEKSWMAAAYSDESLVTSVDGLHADHAEPGDHPIGLPTSSSTLPSLAVQMYRHAKLYYGARLLDVGTGSGYGCALLAHRYGDSRVTTVDVDPYLTEAAAERLARVGSHPHVITADATGPLTGRYDRIVSMVAVRPIPPGWIEALCPGGRLVTTITGTSVILTADKQEDGTLFGRVERDWAGFMNSRTGPRYPPGLDAMFHAVEDAEGEHVGPGRYPVLDIEDAWDLRTVYELAAPGVHHVYRVSGDGLRTAWMLHADGSWARASAHGTDPPTVHQCGPRRLWDLLDEIRFTWLCEGGFPVRGALALIKPDGSVHLKRGMWRTTIT